MGHIELLQKIREMRLAEKKVNEASIKLLKSLTEVVFRVTLR